MVEEYEVLDSDAVVSEVQVSVADFSVLEEYEVLDSDVVVSVVDVSVVDDEDVVDEVTLVVVSSDSHPQVKMC